MANYSRYLLRMLPSRRWPLPGLGSVWLSQSRPAVRLLWPPSGHGFVAQMVADMEHQLQEMERLSRAFFRASPLMAWEREDRRPRDVDLEAGAAAGAGEKDGNYRFAMDVAGFAPEEMTVKLDGRKVTVVAQCHRESHGEENGSWEERQELRREILLPDNVDLEAISCSLASDGQLCIVAPRLATGRAIPIDVKPAVQETSGEDSQEKPKDS
ncbi:heat shock protein 30C [Pogona vitticeps]